MRGYVHIWRFLHAFVRMYAEPQATWLMNSSCFFYVVGLKENATLFPHLFFPFRISSYVSHIIMLCYDMICAHSLTHSLTHSGHIWPAADALRYIILFWASTRSGKRQLDVTTKKKEKSGRKKSVARATNKNKIQERKKKGKKRKFS